MIPVEALVRCIPSAHFSRGRPGGIIQGIITTKQGPSQGIHTPCLHSCKSPLRAPMTPIPADIQQPMPP